MKSRLFALASAALVLLVVAVPAAHAATAVVISQVSFRGTGGANDEAIEIRNVSSSAVDIAGWQLWGSNSNTPPATSARATVPENTTLPVGTTYVFANSAGKYAGSGDVLYGTGIVDTGGVQIRSADGTVMDAVGHTAVQQAYREGAGLPFPTSGTGFGFVRKEGGTQDTDDNPSDFTGPQELTPTRCGTACAAAGPCDPGPDGTTPITSIQTLGPNAACDGTTVTIRGIVTGVDDLYGSNFANVFRADSGIWVQSPTRGPQATTSSALFVAGVARPTPPTAYIGRDITISGRVETKFGLVQIVPNGVGNTSNPDAPQVSLDSVATTHSQGNPLPAPVVIDETAAETQDPITRPYYRSLQGMRVQLPVGIATGGGTTKFRDVFVEPGTDAQRLFRKNDQAAIDTPWADAPAELGIAPDGGAHNPADPRLTWFSETQVNLDLFDIVRNVVGPLTYSFSYYKIMPQIGGPAPTIERGPIHAAYPPAVPDSAPDTLRVASFNVENLFPVGATNDGHVITQDEYDKKVAAIRAAIRNFLREPDVIAVQEVAVVNGVSALDGLAQALGDYTPYIAPNNDGRGIAPGFLIKNGIQASNGEVIGEERPSPWGSASVCDLHPGPLFDRAPYKLEVKKGDIALVALSNHFASQSHQNACRISEAEYVREQAEAFQAQGKHVLVAGDLNDFEFSQTLSTLTQGSVLANMWSRAPQGAAYSYKFNGHLQTLDHILVTAGLGARVTDMRYVHFDSDYYERSDENPYTDDETDGTGISDHDPPVVTFELRGASTSEPGTISATVPATLSLTLGPIAPLGPFVPGIATDYTTTMTATVTSTGEDAALSVLDSSANAPGRLVNGAHALASPLQVSADGGAFTPLRTDNGPLALTAWDTPITKRPVQLGFKQAIGETEGLRTGTYAKTLTFTLATTSP